MTHLRAALLVLFFVAAGCSGERPMGKVSGVVTYHGKPVTSGIVQFRSESGPIAGSGLDANGRFTLTTKKGGDGAWAGSHRVVVMPFIPSAAELAPGQPLPNPTNIPKRYRSFDTSPLTAEVVGGQMNEFTFDLQD
jgi:hypothetical protein